MQDASARDWSRSSNGILGPQTPETIEHLRPGSFFFSLAMLPSLEWPRHFLPICSPERTAARDILALHGPKEATAPGFLGIQAPEGAAVRDFLTVHAPEDAAARGFLEVHEPEGASASTLERRRIRLNTFVFFSRQREHQVMNRQCAALRGANKLCSERAID